MLIQLVPVFLGRYPDAHNDTYIYIHTQRHIAVAVSWGRVLSLVRVVVGNRERKYFRAFERESFALQKWPFECPVPTA